MSSAPLLHLASSSPRRQEILRALGLTFTAQGADIDESRLDGETPEQMVLRLAAAKASAAVAAEGQLVLGADTAVVLGGRVLGKPRDESDAVEMLLRLSGCTHRVLTGVALQTSAGSKVVVSATDVRFREIDRDEARAYWHSGEPRDKAGAYAIQGLGGMFVEAISGSYSGVVGLPVFETVNLLRAAGVTVLVNEE
ncbi:MAG: septum formation inhibitor Maf [Proteobacteria bacterium]|nr:septum formation inhibitor Maf [Pseudomonadota bacterium]